MDLFVSLGIAALLEALADKKSHVRLAPKFAKVLVSIERASITSPVLREAIIAAREKGQ